MKTIKGIDDSLRLEIIGEYLSGASKYSLVKKYNLYGSGQLISWLRIFGIEDRPQAGLPLKEVEMSKSESEELQSLRQELKQLKKDLAHERLRSTAYDKMIALAEEKFNIDIRKKSGSKPSKR